MRHGYNSRLDKSLIIKDSVSDSAKTNETTVRASKLPEAE